MAEQNREHRRRFQLNQELNRQNRAASAAARRGAATPEQQAAGKWDQRDLVFRLRVETAGLDGGLAEVLALTTLRKASPSSSAPAGRGTSGCAAEQVDLTPTPKQLLYRTPGGPGRPPGGAGRGDEPGAAWVEVRMRGEGGHWTASPGETARLRLPLPRRAVRAGKLYTLDADPNNIYAYWACKTVQALRARVESGQASGNPLYERIRDPAGGAAPGPRRQRRASSGSWRASTRCGPWGRCRGSSRGSGSTSAATATRRSSWSRGRRGPARLLDRLCAAGAAPGRDGGGPRLPGDRLPNTHAATDVLLGKILRLRRAARDLRTAIPTCGRSTSTRACWTCRSSASTPAARCRTG